MTWALSRREFLVRAGASGAALLLPGVPSAWFGDADSKHDTRDSVVVRWNQAALQGLRDSKLGPPMVARALAVVHTAACDA